MWVAFASLQPLPRSVAVFALSERNLYRALHTSPDGVAVPCVCRLVSKQTLSWQNATTDVQFVFKGPQYNSSGVLSDCITIPQQWRAVKLHHNTTAVACSQVASQYNGGVQSSCITTPQQWRADHLNHKTKTVVCCQVASQYHNSGVLSSFIKIPQQWRAVHLHHNTTTVVCCQLRHNTTVACSQVASQYHSSGVLFIWITIPQRW